jgi:molecular chaperone DnaJ
MEKDLYQTLQIDKNASEKEIKAAYLKLAKEWHPDRNRHRQEEAEKRMKEINEAYGVLGDKEKRKQYDFYGNQSSFGGSRQTSEDFSDGSSFFEDIFSNFFHKGEKKEIEEDIYLEINISFKDSIFGTNKKIFLSLKRACFFCKKSGALSSADIITCNNCQGRGVVSITQSTVLGYIRTQTTCSKCQGKGKTIKQKCPECLGKKIITKKEEITFNIPWGINPEKEYRYPDLGNDSLHNNKRGDIIVKFKVKENAYFIRKNNNIYVEVPISFYEAILGAEVKVITLEKIETIKIKPGTQNNNVTMIKNYGCFLGIGKKERGDFYIYWQVKIPEKISEAIAEALRTIKRLTVEEWNPNKKFIKDNEDVINK